MIPVDSRNTPPLVQRGTVPWVVMWLFMLSLCAFLVDIVMVYWVWGASDYGNPLRPTGLAHFRWVLQQELEILHVTLDGTASADPIGMALQFSDTLYRFFFGFTGLDTAGARFATLSAPIDEVDPAMRSFYYNFYAVFETGRIGIQLFGVRLAVLCLSMPLFLLVAAVGFADGWVARYLRRAAVGRESSYLYHRFKHLLLLSIIAAWGVYLLTPVPLDPRIIILPFVFTLGLTVRWMVTYFKKYL